MSSRIRRRRNGQLRRGFTLIELLVAMTILAAVAAIIVPQLSDDSRIRVVAGAFVLTSDLEYAQVRNITHPKDPLIVKFDVAQKRYWIARAATPDTPIIRTDTGEAYLVQMGFGRARSASGVTIALHDVANDTIIYDAQGGLVDFDSQPQIVLTCGTESLTLNIAPTTGTITEVEGS